MCIRDSPKRGGVTDHRGGGERRWGLEGQTVLGMVGSRPQLVAPFNGQPGPGGDALKGLPVGGVTGLIDQSE